MVFFVCDACGQSFKKNQVEKHLWNCKRSKFMSCLDCNIEFWGDDYKTHIKCISEEEKYGGKDYKAKESSQKGEKKQNTWIELVEEVISSSTIKPHLVHVMQEILTQPNLPRKQIKFENFIKNSLRHKNPVVVKEAWNIFSEAQNKFKNQTPSKANQSSKSDVKSVGDVVGEDVVQNQESNIQSESNPVEQENDKNGISKSKKKKKKKHGTLLDIELQDQEEAKDLSCEVKEEINPVEFEKSENGISKSKKKKNKKREAAIDLEIEDQEEVKGQSCEVTEIHKKKKSKKGHKDKETEEIENSEPHLKENSQSEIMEDTSSTNIKKKKKKNKSPDENSSVETKEPITLVKEENTVENFKKKKKRKHQESLNENSLPHTDDVSEVPAEVKQIDKPKKKKKKNKGNPV